MFAVLKTGGKQYTVRSGDILRVELLDTTAGETLQFNDILMLGGDAPAVGAPLVEGAAVQAQVIDNIKADKVIHFVKRRRKHSSQRTKGHRQKLTLLRVTDILVSGAETSGVKVAIGTAHARVAAHNSQPLAPQPDPALSEAAAKPKRAAKKAAADVQE